MKRHIFSIVFLTTFLMVGLGAEVAKADDCPAPGTTVLETIPNCIFRFDVKVSSLTAAVASGQSRVFILGTVNRVIPIQLFVTVPASEGGQTLSACVSLGQDASKGQRALNLVGLGDYSNEDGPSIYTVNINATSDHSLSCALIY